MNQEYIRINREAYDALYREYDLRAVIKSDFEERIDVLGGAVFKHIASSFENITVLEIGPGSGEMLAYFESHGCRTFAIELSPNIARVAKARSPRTTIVIGNVLDFEFTEGTFPIIYAGAVVHLFPLEDAIDLVKRFYRWLSPKGVLFISTTIHKFSEEGYYIKSDYGKQVKRFRRKWVESEFLSLLLGAGFQVVERLFTDEKDRSKKWVALICTKPVVSVD